LPVEPLVEHIGESPRARVGRDGLRRRLARPMRRAGIAALSGRASRAPPLPLPVSFVLPETVSPSTAPLTIG